MDSEATLSDGSKRPFRSLKVGALRINERDRCVISGEKSTPLTDLSWRFLMTLINASPAPANIPALCEQVWESPHVSPETIAQRARQLRQALGDDPKAPRYIRTIRGGGYQLIPQVELLSEAAKQTVVSSAWRMKIARYGLIGLLLVAAAAMWIASKQTRSAIPSASPQTNELMGRADEYRRRGSAQDNEISIEIYRQVLASDPDQVQALIGLSLSLAHKPSKHDLATNFAEQATAVADRALVLDPTNARAWAARGLADDARGWVSSALSYYQRARQLKPNYPSVISGIAYLKQVQGQLHESLILETQALKLAPPTYFADFQIATTLRLAGLTGPADAWFERATRLRPDNVFLPTDRARAMMVQRQFEQAIVALDGAQATRFFHHFLRGLVLIKLGQPDQAKRAFQAGQNQAEQQGRECAYCIAMLAYAGDSQAILLARRLLPSVEKPLSDAQQWPEYRVELAMLSAALDDEAAAVQHLNDALALGYLNDQWLQQLPPLETVLSGPPGTALIAEIRRRQQAQRRLIENDASLKDLLQDLP